jgi:hypothetical protein
MTTVTDNVFESFSIAPFSSSFRLSAQLVELVVRCSPRFTPPPRPLTRSTPLPTTPPYHEQAQEAHRNVLAFFVVLYVSKEGGAKVSSVFQWSGVETSDEGTGRVGEDAPWA